MALQSHYSGTSIFSLFSLLHGRVRELLPVDDQVGVVRGLECKTSVTDAAAVASFLVLLHDVL